ncbi:ABC transporter ATP-binding protein [Paenibacillus lemnae]|nr:ABC transporter ATP-binding protein [Paenibacillus lemnae]
MEYIKKLYTFSGRKLILGIAGMMLVSLLEGTSILLLAPMLSLTGLIGPTSDSLPFLVILTAPIMSWSDEQKLTLMLGIFVFLFALQGAVQRHLVNMNEQIEQGFIRHLRLDVYESMIYANWSFFLRKRRSDLVHLMTSELPRVSYGISLLLGLCTTVVFTAVQIGFALYLSFELTAAVLVCGIALALYSRQFIRRSRKIGAQATELSQQCYAGITDHLNGMKDIKANMLEIQHLNWFQQLCHRLEHNVVSFTKLQTTSQYYYKLASAVLLAVFAFFSFVVFHVQPERLMIIVLIFSRLWPKFTGLQTSWEHLAQSAPAFGHLSAMQKEIQNARELELPDMNSGNFEHTIRFDEAIECRHVCYRYHQEHHVHKENQGHQAHHGHEHHVHLGNHKHLGHPSPYALKDIHLRIPVHTLTAIVGKSGAGKSTLVDLLIGLIKPDQGELLIDGKPLTNEVVYQLRQKVSYVSQDPFLFHGTLLDNLLAAAPNATDKQIWDALHFSAAEAFVRKLPEGLDTIVGDRGIRLSGGERQRIVLARAILRQPAILILDEATSALDSENEALIQNALMQLRGKMTIIVIAHRLSTIRHADQVFVLDGGMIIQRGGYQQLASEREGLFGKLLHVQTGTN